MDERSGSEGGRKDGWRKKIHAFNINLVFAAAAQPGLDFLDQGQGGMYNAVYI